MKKPAQGTIILTPDLETSYLVVHEEPTNWKEGVGVREMLPDGRLGELRIFGQKDITVCVSANQVLGCLMKLA